MQVNFSNQYPKYCPQIYSSEKKGGITAGSISQGLSFGCVRKVKKSKFLSSAYLQNVIIRIQRFLSRKEVSYSFELNEVNSALLGKGFTKLNSVVTSCTPVKTVSEIMSITDKQFKKLKPLEENITLWRGIARSNIYSDLFNEASMLKIGDELMMPQYAFASDSKHYAKAFSSKISGKGLLFQIEVPKGSRISRNIHYIFPRNSEFVCTGVEEDTYRMVKLRYKQPEEGSVGFCEKILNFFKRS